VHRKRRSSLAVQSLLSDGMMYSIVACAAVGTDCAKSTIPLLFTDRCLVTAGYCDSTILALSECATRCLKLLEFRNLSLVHILEAIMFRKLDLFPSSDGGDTYSVGSLRNS
jgi:hypothetical protein